MTGGDNLKGLNKDYKDDFLISTQSLILVKSFSLGQRHFVLQVIINSPYHYRKYKIFPSSFPVSSPPTPTFLLFTSSFLLGPCSIYPDLFGSVKPFYTSLFLLHGIKINKARRNSPILLKSPHSFCFQSLNKSSSNELGLKVNCVY